MKKAFLVLLGLMVCALSVSTTSAFNFFGGKNFTTLTPRENVVDIPLKDIDDGEAHYFKVKALDGTVVSFLTLKSTDGVIRAAIDACDVCYKAGKGYTQEGDFMVCENCGQRFASNRINEVKGGCNPAPLERVIDGDRLVIKMADIGKNSWYCKYKPQ